VLVRSILHTQPLGLSNEILVGNLFVHRYFSSPPLFLLISTILHRVNTRNRVTANNAQNNGESNNQEANPPPPPPLTLKQVRAMQAQMLQTMQQTLVNLHAQPQAPLPSRDRLGDFQRTKPPTFSYAVEPMDADDWLKSVEKKLQQS
jgi:hypothetical protein